MKTACGFVSLGVIPLTVMGLALIGGAEGYAPGPIGNPQVRQQDNRVAARIVPVSDNLQFINPEPVAILGYDGFMDEPFISRDGQYLSSLSG
jgi:hypothetical protein